MYEEPSSKFSNLKKRAKSAVGKSDNSETLGFKKKKFGGIDNRGKVKRGEIKFNVEDDEFRRRNDRKSNSGYRGNRGDGVKSDYGGRKTGESKFSEGKRTEQRGFRDHGKQSWESVLSKRGSRDGRNNDGNGENRMFNRTFSDRGSRGNGENRMFNRRDSGNGGGGGDRRNNTENGENRTFSDRGSRGNGENRMFNRRDSGGGDRRNNTENGENRTFSDRGSRGNGESRMFNRRDSREGGGGRRNNTENSENITFSDRGSRDGRGDRRNNSENGEDRSGLLRKNGVFKDENSEKLQSPLEDHEFGRKKFYKKYMAAGDSMTSFDRPKRKRRLIRIGYRNDTANKRFDDTIAEIAPIDNNTKQKEDSDTEEIAENPEMSQNAQFRAIQPTPSIISFVNENLLGRRREIDFRKAGYNIELPSPLDDTPFSTSSDRAKIEESVFRNKLAFFAAAKVSSSFPSPDLPEIAFAGRSNVGKSSLLNSLTRQWGVVRTSDKPGLTQTINFFNLGSKLCLVDLPGYGFAYAKDEVKESWEELVKEYVSTREGLKRVCLLIDTKWGMKARDHELVDLMERSKTKYQIVLTKTDLSFPVDVARRATQIEESLKTKKSALQPLMMVSSKTGAGIRSLRTVLSNISRFARL